ncbi:hypothetical protein GGF43_004693, partial [Coemansia sp. RSA 2618]
AKSAAKPKRFRWTKERDELLFKLVANRNGRRWADIADELGVEGHMQKVQSRWIALQPKCRSSWTKKEDAELSSAIKECVQSGRTLGERGMWVAAAKRLKTNRTPAQCRSRWTDTLFPKQGKALELTRFDNVRGWSWRDDEVARLRSALRGITDVQGSANALARAAKREPWLLINKLHQGNRVGQFWVYVASRVGTRTSMQCRRKWEAMEVEGVLPEITTSEARRLAELVKVRGTKWRLLADEEFPGKTPQLLYSTYAKWKHIENTFGVDLLQIDPSVRLRDYNGRSAMRPTGADGFYDPNGPLVRVSKRGKSSALTPYLLSCINSRSRFTGLRGLPDARLASGSDKTRISPETTEKLVAAISLHKDDWTSISRSVGLPPNKCRRYAEALSAKLPMLRRLLHNEEIAEFVSRHKARQSS